MTSSSSNRSMPWISSFTFSAIIADRRAKATGSGVCFALFHSMLIELWLKYLELKLDVFHLAYNRHRVELETIVEEPPRTEPSNNTLSHHLHRWDSWSKVKQNLSNKNESHSTSPSEQQRRLVFEDVTELFSKEMEDLRCFSSSCRRSTWKSSLTNCTSIFDRSAMLRVLFWSTSMSWESIWNKCVFPLESSWVHRQSFPSVCLHLSQRSSIGLHAVRVFGIQDDEEQRPIVLSSASPSARIDLEFFPVNRLRLIIEPLRLFYHAVSWTLGFHQSNGFGVLDDDSSIDRNFRK